MKIKLLLHWLYVYYELKLSFQTIASGCKKWCFCPSFFAFFAIRLTELLLIYVTCWFYRKAAISRGLSAGGQAWGGSDSHGWHFATGEVTGQPTAVTSWAMDVRPGLCLPRDAPARSRRQEMFNPNQSLGFMADSYWLWAMALPGLGIERSLSMLSSLVAFWADGHIVGEGVAGYGVTGMLTRCRKECSLGANRTTKA